MNRFIILVYTVLLSSLLIVFSSCKDSNTIYEEKKIYFNNAVTFIKENKIIGEYYVDGRLLSTIGSKASTPLDSAVSKIGIETNLTITSLNGNQFYVSFQVFPQGWDEGEYYIQYFDDGLNRDDVYKNDFESSRMSVKILDKNWILFVEFPNIGGYGK